MNVDQFIAIINSPGFLSIVSLVVGVVGENLRHKAVKARKAKKQD